MRLRIMVALLLAAFIVDSADAKILTRFKQRRAAVVKNRKPIFKKATPKKRAPAIQKKAAPVPNSGGGAAVIPYEPPVRPSAAVPAPPAAVPAPLAVAPAPPLPAPVAPIRQPKAVKPVAQLPPAVALPPNFITPADPNWRSKLVAVAAYQDRIEAEIQASVQEQAEFLAALEAMGLRDPNAPAAAGGGAPVGFAYGFPMDRPRPLPGALSTRKSLADTVLANKCVSCHNSEQPSGGLSLGKPDMMTTALGYKILERITTIDPKKRMPRAPEPALGPAPLSIEETAILYISAFVRSSGE